MRVLLLSTYELGQQPAALGALGAVALSAGHEVEAVDLSISDWPADEVERADAICFSVPMHTATELALNAARRIAESGRRPPFFFFGLYAGVIEGHSLLRNGDVLCAGEAAEAFACFLEKVSSGVAEPARLRRELGPPRLAPSPPPRRDLLQPLASYARYLVDGESVLTAAVESSRGCNHTCRHCPVPVVYEGRSRAVPLDSVLADVDEVVSLGAKHVSFSDPDFLNRPSHALTVARAVHERHQELTFDATVKVEHVLRHAELWPELSAAGLSFVVSAFESTDDEVLAILDKGHTARDEFEAVATLRSAGVEPRPSFLPFSPWTSKESIAGLLELVARADLVSNTDPVQYSIRLLLPTGSLLSSLADPVLEESVERAREEEGSFGSVPWRHSDPSIDHLQEEIAQLVESSAAAGRAAEEVFQELWVLARRSGVPVQPAPPPIEPRYSSGLDPAKRPHLSESWFCCAEPTVAQLEALSR